MVKKKHPTTKKTGFGGLPKDGAGSSQRPVAKDTGKRPAIEPNEEEQRKKKKTEEDDEEGEGLHDFEEEDTEEEEYVEESDGDDDDA